MGENMSPADLKAVLGNNGTTIAYPFMSGFGGNGFGNGDWSWILLLILLSGYGGFGGGFGGFGGMMGMDLMYPWLANGQQEIMTNTNNGFDNLHLSNQIEGVRDGIYGLSNQLCNCCADMNQTVSAGFANAETAANNRQMANMQQAFSNQLSTVQGFNGLGVQLCEDAGENRLAIANLNSTILSENCADRYEAAKNTRDIIEAVNANGQRIVNELFRDRLDEKDSKIQELNREIQSAELRASQIAQTQAITSNIYNELKNCPVGTVPVFGNQPIFTCSNNLNNGGCGCGGFNNTIV